MNKQDVRSAIRAIRHPPTLALGADALSDVIPEGEFVAAYPSFRYTDVESWEREDTVVLLTDRLLLVCKAMSKGLEVVDAGHGSELRQEWRTTSIDSVDIANLSRIKMESTEGPRTIGSGVVKQVALELSWSNDTDVLRELPFPHDLAGADANDREAVYGRVAAFATALLLVSGAAR